MIRIVKMTFKESEVENFLRIFEESKTKIAAFEGCSHLELLRDLHQGNIFFTYSYWDNKEALNNYRHSSLFREIWGRTKLLFNERAEAWSVEHFAFPV